MQTRTLTQTLALPTEPELMSDLDIRNALDLLLNGPAGEPVTTDGIYDSWDPEPPF